MADPRRSPEVPGYTAAPPPGAGGPPVTPASGTLTGRHVLSGWWPRAGALIIDGLIVGAAALVLMVALTAPFSIGFFAGDTFGFVALVVGLLIAIICVSIAALLYAPAMMARTNGRTVGRMATGIRVVRADGKPIDFGFALLREVVVKALLFGFLATLTGGLSFLADSLWPLWDEENRALHDFVVDTRTIVV